MSNSASGADTELIYEDNGVPDTNQSEAGHEEIDRRSFLQNCWGDQWCFMTKDAFKKVIGLHLSQQPNCNSWVSTHRGQSV